MAGETTTVLRRSPAALFRFVGAEVLLAPPGRRDFDLLGGVGTDVWRLMADPVDLEDLVRVLANRYGADLDLVGRDVRTLVDALVAAGLAEHVGEHGHRG